MHLHLKSADWRKPALELPLIPGERSDALMGTDLPEEPVVFHEGVRYELTLHTDQEVMGQVCCKLYINRGEEQALAEGHGPLKPHAGLRLVSNEREDHYVIFWGIIDVVELVVEISSSYSESKQYYRTPPMLCAYNSGMQRANIEGIISTLMHAPEGPFANLLFLPGHTGSPQGASSKQPSHKSPDAILQIARSIRETYVRNAPFFQKKARHIIAHTRALVSFDQVKYVSHDDVQWLAQNMEMLAPAPKRTGINIRGHHYLPHHLESGSAHRSLDVYENQVICAFLKLVSQKLYGIIEDVRHKQQHMQEWADRFREKNPDVSVPIVSVKHISGQILGHYVHQLSKVATSLDALQQKYASFLGCKSITLHTRPRYTPTFRNSPPYREIYELITRWFEYGEWHLTSHHLLFRLRSVHKLYEYFCLLRLLQQIHKDGFALQSASSFRYAQASHSPEIPNTFLFGRDEMQLTLYYEPYINEKGKENGIELNRIYAQEEGGANFWKPDFVLRVDTPHSRRYAILDAKFAWSDSILRTRHNEGYMKMGLLSEIAMKYGYWTSHGSNPVEFVWCMQGRIDNHVEVHYLFNTPNVPCSVASCPVNATNMDCFRTLWQAFRKKFGIAVSSEPIQALQKGAS